MGPSNRLPLAAVVVALVLLGGACGDDAVVTSPVTDQTGAPATTAGATSTTATTAPSDGRSPDGAGCTPGSDTLGDGRWFGYVRSARADGLSFDLACWFSGEAAVAAAAEDGVESPPPNDYHVRNDSDRLRDVPVDPEQVTARWYRQTGDPGTATETPYDEWLAARADGVSLGVWVEVADGDVVRIEEQWVP